MKNIFFICTVIFTCLYSSILLASADDSDSWNLQESLQGSTRYVAAGGGGGRDFYNETEFSPPAIAYADLSRIERLRPFIPETYIENPWLGGEFDLRTNGIRFSKRGEILIAGARHYLCAVVGGVEAVCECVNAREVMTRPWPIASFIDKKVSELKAIRLREDFRASIKRGEIEGVSISSIPGSVRIGMREYALAAGRVLMEYEIGEDVKSTRVDQPWESFFDRVVSNILTARHENAERSKAIERHNAETSRVIERKREKNKRKTFQINERKKRREEAVRRRKIGERIREAKDLGIRDPESLGEETLRLAMQRARAAKLGVEGAKFLKGPQLKKKIKEKKEEEREKERRRRVVRDYAMEAGSRRGKLLSHYQDAAGFIDRFRGIE